MSLLLPSRPIVVIPELVMRVGLHEAMLLQQIHYWASETTSGIDHDERRWVYNTIGEWMEQFPFLSESSIKRAFASLKSQGIVYVEKLSSDPRDKTNFYAINYEHRALTDEVKLTPCMRSKCTDATGQSEPMQQVKLTPCMRSKCTDATGQSEPMQQVKLARCNRSKRAVLHTESTTEKKEPPLTPPAVDNSGAGQNQTAGDIFDFLNLLTGAKTRPDLQAIKPILERLTDGYTADEIKLVIEYRIIQLRGKPDLGHMLSPNFLFSARDFGAYFSAATDWQKKRDQQAARESAVEQQRIAPPPAGDVPEIDFDEVFDRLFVDGGAPENQAERIAMAEAVKNGFGSGGQDQARKKWRVILSRACAKTAGDK